jgi:hypothetical protein
VNREVGQARGREYKNPPNFPQKRGFSGDFSLLFQNRNIEKMQFFFLILAFLMDV